jgi:hypothetical protein
VIGLSFIASLIVAQGETVAAVAEAAGGGLGGVPGGAAAGATAGFISLLLWKVLDRVLPKKAAADPGSSAATTKALEKLVDAIDDLDKHSAERFERADQKSAERFERFFVLVANQMLEFGKAVNTIDAGIKSLMQSAERAGRAAPKDTATDAS